MPTIHAFHVYVYGPNRGPIRSSFEETEARLAKLPELHFEPDGSFVWTRCRGTEQLFGMIYDAAGSLQYCEIQGKCSHATWMEVLHAICPIDDAYGIEVMTLPNQQLEDLQQFERSHWPDAFRS